MATYTGYFIFNQAEFELLALGSKTYTVNLPDLGEKDILVTKGNLLSITFEGVLLPAGLNDKNQFTKDGYGISLDDNGDVYLCIQDPDET